MQDFFITLLKTTALQLISMLGIFFAFGFVLSKLQSWTHTIYHRSLGWFGIIWTAWIGTPFHELSHAFFAKLFGHRISEISLFSPNQATGGLGHVEHSYNPRNIYQKLGNFFIGAAPMLIGSLLLTTLLYFLVPNGKAIFHALPSNLTDIHSIFASLRSTLELLFVKENLHAWNFWLFLYISFAIASHLAPSQQDRKNMWSGLFWIVLILFIVNAIALFLHVDITSYILSINTYVGVFIAIFVYATLLSLLHLIVATLLLLPFRR